MAPDTALAELRLSTRLEHERIEAVLRLTEPMSMSRYAVVMSGFDTFLGVWEPRMQEALPARLQAWFRARRRGGFASADVEWLRTVAGQPRVALEATAAAALRFDELPTMLGSIYVLEGSALGGRAVAPGLKAALGVGPGCGASYFNGFGGEAGTMWRDYRALAALEIGDSGPVIERACHSARQTFAALIDVFAPLAMPAPTAQSPEPKTDDPLRPVD